MKNKMLFWIPFLCLLFLSSCKDNTQINEPLNENISVKEITVSQALEIGNALNGNATTKETYSITGYVILVDPYGLNGAGTQTFYISDNKEKPGKLIGALNCKISSPGIVKFDRVNVVGKITKLVAGSTISIKIESGDAQKVKDVEDSESVNENISVKKITVSQALEIGDALNGDATTKETYSITGYVILVDPYGFNGAGTQTFYMSDKRDEPGRLLGALNCKISSPGAAKFDMVSVVGKITKFVSGSAVSVRVENGEGQKVKEVEDFSISGTLDGHDYVDLGLSVKWATCNLGAQTPWEIGEHYAWAEVTPYTEWTYYNYKFKFAPCSPDHVLDKQFDAVTINWGKSWRMPTREEIEELIDPNKCEWVWVNNINGTSVSGYRVMSKKNGKCIFLPAGKYSPHENYLTPTEEAGYYWCSTALPSVEKSPSDHTSFTIFFQNGIHYEGTQLCYDGLNIRGVVGTPNSYFSDDNIAKDEVETKRQGFTVNGKVGKYTYVDLGLPSRTLWATYNLGAQLPHEYGEYYAWGETKPKNLYDQVTYKFFQRYSETGPYFWAQYSKYVCSKEHGTPDFKLSLDSEDDAAAVNWGLQWQTPSIVQFDELITYCTWFYKDIVVDGRTITGVVGKSNLNGNTIYFPLADFKYKQIPLSYLSIYYWASELAVDNDGSGTDYYAFNFNMVTSGGGFKMIISGTERFYGFPVRPVVKK